MKVNIEVSIGELVDKISILEIKLEKIDDKEKKLNIQKEYELLKVEYKKLLEKYADVDDYFLDIKEVNLDIWSMEENIRELISQKKFDTEYIDMAREIQRKNDQRFEIKNEINKVFQSSLLEQKSYPGY